MMICFVDALHYSSATDHPRETNQKHSRPTKDVLLCTVTLVGNNET